MLKRLRLTDFKSFVDEAVDFAPFTLLVGANASGKSNCLDALHFLHELIRDQSVLEILDGEQGFAGGQEASPGLRRTGGTTASYGICLGLLPGPPPSEADIVVEPASALHETCQRIHTLDIRPERMRGYGKKNRPQLGPDGSNFSAALAHLCEDREEKQALVDWLTELLAPEIADIDFVDVKELGDVMAILVEKDGKRVPARGLSDGTLRFLGLLLALRTAEPGSLYLIEDIDSGLHPARVHVLVEFLEALVREREVQVIATTHAPVVLQAVSRETLLSAVVFGRVPGHEGTLMRRLGDLPHFEEALARKGIDELFATGWLEMAL